MAKLPTRLRAGAASKTAFTLQPDLYAVRRRSTVGAGDALLEVQDDADTRFAVYAGRPGSELRAGDVGPVYSAGPGGPLAVPTGRMLIRLEDQVRPEAARDRFAAAGFEIERLLAYAPHAVWLKPREDGVAQALASLAALKRIPGVVDVEPQLLIERAAKTRD